MYNQSDKHFLLTNIYHLNINIINKNKFSIDILGYTTFEQIEKTIRLLYTGNYNMNIYIINNNVDFNYEIINNKKQKINSSIDYQKPIIDIINNINNDVIDIEVQVNMYNYNDNNENNDKNYKKKLFKNLSVSNNNFFYYNNYNNKVNFNNKENSFYKNSSNIKNNINNNNIYNSNIKNSNIINNNNLNNSSNFINSFCDNINSSNKNINTFSKEKKINFNEISNLEISNIKNDDNYNETKEKNESYLKLNNDFSKMAINDILKEDLIALCESVKRSKSFISNSKTLEKKLIKNQTPNKTKRKWEESSKYLKTEIILKGAKKIKLLISIINEFCNLIDFYIEIHNESLENVKKNITNIDNNTIINNKFLQTTTEHFHKQLNNIREKYFRIVTFWNNFYENLNRFFDKKNNLNIIFEIKYNLNNNRIIEIDNNFIENNINDYQSKREIILNSKSKIKYNFVDFIGYPIKKTNQIYYYHNGNFLKTEINFPFNDNNSKNSIISSKSIENKTFYDKLSFCNYDNYLYISGGIYYEIDNESNTSIEKISNKVFIINLKTKECNKLPSLKYRRHSHSSIFYNNNLYVIGGSKCLKNEVLNIFYNEWKLLPDLKSERKFPILFIGNNKLYVFGGIDSNSIIKLSFLILDLNFDNNWIENECKIYENNKIVDSMFLFGSGVFRFFFNDEDALYFFGGFTKNNINNIYNSNKKKSKKKENLIIYNNNIYKYKFSGNKFFKLNNKQTESIFFEESCLKFFFSEDILRCEESIFFGIGVKKNNEIMPFCIDPLEYLKN